MFPYSMRFVYKVIIAISAALLVGCSGSESSAPITNKNKLDWIVQGNSYKYYTKGGCRIESNNEVCIPKESFIEICANRPAISTYAVRGLGLSNSRFAAISGSGISVSYVIDQNSESPCLIKVTADGILRGTSTTITVVAEPANFVMNDSGEILISYAVYLYEE